MSSRLWHLFKELLLKEFGRDFHGTVTGWFWFVLNPLLLLATYAFVFGVIFQARVPSGLDVPFVAWLAVALWPWLAFSDGVLRGAQAIGKSADILAKVAIPRYFFPLSVQSSAFLLQMLGYIVVLLTMLAMGIELHWVGLPYLFLLLLTLFIMSTGLALLTSAVMVYVRDLAQFLPTLFLFWFFLTPILYPPEALPDQLGYWLRFNPLAWWMEEIRATLFDGKSVPDITLLYLSICAAMALGLGWWVFDRLNTYFEDFL